MHAGCAADFPMLPTQVAFGMALRFYGINQTGFPLDGTDCLKVIRLSCDIEGGFAMTWHKNLQAPLKSSA